MNKTQRVLVAASAGCVAVLLALLPAANLLGQQAPQPAPAPCVAKPPSKCWTAAQEHKNMMDQLGIKALRPGPSGTETAPDHANYDESKANPFPNLPAVLTLKNGKKVTTAKMWWNQRRPEIVEDFDREVLGCVPRSVLTVTPKQPLYQTLAPREYVAGKSR